MTSQCCGGPVVAGVYAGEWIVLCNTCGYECEGGEDMEYRLERILRHMEALHEGTSLKNVVRPKVVAHAISNFLGALPELIQDLDAVIRELEAMKKSPKHLS